MYNIHYLNKISPKGTELWAENYQFCDQADHADAIYNITNDGLCEQYDK